MCALLAALALGGLVTTTGCNRAVDAPEPAPTAGASTSPAAPATPPRPPRLILLLSLDTLRADHLGSYGYPRFTSPVLDTLASESVVFDDASSPSPWTLPAHASMLTGLYPLGHRVTSTRTGLPKSVRTLTELLARAGYDSAAVVNSDWLKQTSFRITRGFEKFLYVRPVASRRSPSNWITDQAIEWIDKMGARPLFLFVHYYDIHSDYASLPEFEKLFVTPYDGIADGTGWQLQRANFTEAYIEMCVRNFEENKCSFGGHPDDDLKYRVDETTSKIHFNERDLQHLRNLYDSGVRQLDTEIGRLLRHLRKASILDDTLLIVTSDHGEAFGEHGEVDHSLTTFQEVLHVPLMIRRQGIPANVRIAEPVSLVDIVPTILVQAGVPLPAGLDGRDLSPLWRGASADEFEQRSLFAEGAFGVTWNLVAPGYYPEYRALRRRQYKMIYASDGDRFMLFDLATDPEETHDLATKKPELYAELRDQMVRRYQNFRPEPTDETRVDVEQEDIENLRALGYIQ